MRTLAAGVLIGLVSFLPVNALAQPTQAEVEDPYEFFLTAPQLTSDESNDIRGELWDTIEKIREERRIEYRRAVRAASRGDPEAQNNLGTMYEQGYGVTQDYAEAVRWYSSAAEQGNSYAQRNLSAMYADGRGVAQDIINAYMWIIISAANGHDGAIEARDNMNDLFSRTNNENIMFQTQRRARICMESGYTNCD
ncbi:tetratricopeptide repeat protein [Fodinicurvata sp. EGI_FJ10296]|uniref:tetratricopeptide repeat protein n=1 Tax=Fodinicurvata sp. EGI_FJ10296 TaxID=3231908 RepID=UPI0034541C43